MCLEELMGVSRGTNGCLKELTGVSQGTNGCVSRN